MCKRLHLFCTALRPLTWFDLVSDLHGSLAGILGMATKSGSSPKLTDSAITKQIEVIEGSKTRNGVPKDTMQIKLVAGVGFEPTTFRL